MARPKKQAHEKRTAQVPPLRVTQAELAQLQDQAKAAGLTVTEFARQRLLSGRVTPARPAVDGQVLTELNRIGVNLNQIARALNRRRPEDPHHLGYVLAHLNGLLEALGRRYGA